MDSTGERKFTRRPSLYTAIRLARLVQQFRERLKAKVNSRAQRDALLQTENTELAQFQSQASAQSQPRDRDNSSDRSTTPVASADFNESNFPGLLRRIDCQLYRADTVHSVDSASRDDSQFLEFDAQCLISSRRIEQASNVLDNTTLLLERIQSLQVDQVMRQQAAADHGFKDGIDFEKYLANVEHLLRTLQHAAFQALLQHSLEVLESDYSHWGRYLEQLQRFGNDWFCEWASGRPPLSSTMPWNIKPSLVVLWGVCWMFYMNNAPSSGAGGQGREDAWMTQPWAPQANLQHLGYTNSTLVPPRNSNQIISHRVGHSPPVVNLNTTSNSTVLGNPNASIGPRQSAPELVGSLPASAYAERPMTHSSANSLDHMMAGRYGGQVTASQQAFGQNSRQEALLEKLNSPLGIGIRTPVTGVPVPVSISDASFATPTSSVWSPTSDPTSVHSFVTHNATGLWQPNFPDDISTRSLYQHHPDSTVNPYAEQLDNLSSAAPSPNLYAPDNYGFTGHFNPSFNPNLRLPMTNHGYPISPHSEASERASSLCPVNLPDNTSPYTQSQTSPSIGHSSGSRQGSISQVQDPPRNNYNQIYCDHPECAPNPPIFSRKCEWTKHMDKHLRPYVCREPGCEKIRGFTYSGGLLRHEREVHRQHGGPKAPRFCPHKDCKRSTGQGFSRKENLNEHLRRVHRSVGIVEGKIEAESPQIPATVLPSQRLQDQPRKRRRDEYEEVEEETESKELMPGASNADLRAEIKRLKAELASKEESIQRMRAVLQMPPTSVQR